MVRDEFWRFSVLLGGGGMDRVNFCTCDNVLEKNSSRNAEVEVNFLSLKILGMQIFSL